MKRAEVKISEDENVKGFREELVLATKLMLHGLGFGGVYKTIRSHLEGSLERLQTDYVDIYYLHRMSGVPVEKVAEVERFK